MSKINRALSDPPLKGHVTATSIAAQWILESARVFRAPYNLCGVFLPLSWFKA